MTDNRRRSDSESDRDKRQEEEPGERSLVVKPIEDYLNRNEESAAAKLLIQLQTDFATLLQYLDQEDRKEERNFFLFLAQSLLREMQKELLDLARSE